MAPRHKLPRKPDPQRGADHNAETSSSVRAGIIAMTVAMLLLLVFNSGGLQGWARNLPGSSMSDLLVSYTDHWHAFMQKIGTAAPKDTVQDAVSDFRRYGWSDFTGIDSTANAEPVGRNEVD